MIFWLGVLLGVVIGSIITVLVLRSFLTIAGRYYGEHPEELDNLFAKSWDRAVENLKKENVEPSITISNPFK